MSSSPRWFTALTKILSDNPKSTLYQLATVDATNKPHVRTVVHRDFLVPATHPALPLLLTTTDRRSAKAAHIAHAAGAPVEICWWIADSGDQFRIAGAARLVPAAPAAAMSGVAAAAAAAEHDCPGLAALDAAQHGWRARAHALFAAVGPAIRASFACGVAPGAPLPHGAAQTDAWPRALPPPADAGEEEQSDVEAALAHYAMLVVEPREVDWVQLGVVPNRRTRWRREGEVWREEAVAP